MPSENFAKYLEDQRLQLEARNQARQRKAKRKHRVPLDSEPTPPRLVKGEKTNTQSAPTFFSTWDTMYRRRAGNGPGTLLFALPESLLDTLLEGFAQLISNRIKKLLP